MCPVRRLLATRQAIHPLGCQRRIPGSGHVGKLIQVLVFGCGYRRIDDHICSATTLRRRRDGGIALGLADRLRLIALAAYDRMIGLELSDRHDALMLGAAQDTLAAVGPLPWEEAG